MVDVVKLMRFVRTLLFSHSAVGFEIVLQYSARRVDPSTMCDGGGSLRGMCRSAIPDNLEGDNAMFDRK